MTPVIAVLGASGFIGNRLVEVLQHAGGPCVRPIVRRAQGAALARRFDLTVHVADAMDQVALSQAFEGCDCVVVAIAGTPRTITEAVEPIYRGAENAGVRRLIYLSTASVHGQAPAPGVDESTPLSTGQSIAYNNAKVIAERRLQALRNRGRVELVILRPGIVFGPRSQWTGGLADELLNGEAYLTEGGWGVCNTIYVDNLVHAVRLALDAPLADGKAYLVGDAEQVTWRDLFAPICGAFGRDLESLAMPSFSDAVLDGLPFIERMQCTRFFQTARSMVPRPVRAGLREAWRELHAFGAESGSAQPTPARLRISLERALLHTSSYKPSFSRAEQDLNYRPQLSFDEGCRRSVSWLSFAGYPVVHAPNEMPRTAAPRTEEKRGPS